MTELRFYMDENVDPAVAEQLKQGGIDIVTARDLEALGDSDPNHLQRATKMERVLCTHDQDFLRLASETVEHTGIAFAEHYGATIGGWVRALKALHASEMAEKMQGQVRFLNVR